MANFISFNQVFKKEEPTVKKGRPPKKVGNDKYNELIETYFSWITENFNKIVKYNVDNFVSNKKDIIPNRRNKVSFSSIPFFPLYLRTIDSFVFGKTDAASAKALFGISKINRDKKRFDKFRFLEKRLISRITKIITLISKGI